MSLNQTKLDVVKIVPSSLDVDKKPYKVDEPLRSHVMRPFPPSGSSGNYNTGAKWTIPMSSNEGLCRRAYVSAQFEITFSCSNAGAQEAAPFPAD